MLLYKKIKNNHCRWSIDTNKKINYDVISTCDIFSVKNDVLYKITGGGNNVERVVIIDSHLYEQHANNIRNYFAFYSTSCKIVTIDGDEDNKNLENFVKICKELDNLQIKRRSQPVIAIGGGVLTDVVSFACSCYRRGIPYIRIPTTLMAYVDAVIGIKTGVNFEGNKNRIGTFSVPLAVIMDHTFFNTLPVRHISNGIGEIIKLAVIKDKVLFELLENNVTTCIKDKFLNSGDEILERAVHGMLEELEPNLFEDNLERIVDFGHTFSPIIEMINANDMLHGESVAIDICLSSILAHIKGLLSEVNVKRIINLVMKSNLPVYHESITPKIMWDGLMERSLHRDGLQRVPLPVQIGEAIFSNDIKLSEIEDTLSYLKNMKH